VSFPTIFSMGAASFPPRGRRRRSVRREDTPPGSRAPRSTTSGHTSDGVLGYVSPVVFERQHEEKQGGVINSTPVFREPR
jgi:hypothetical protein